MILRFGLLVGLVSQAAVCQRVPAAFPSWDALHWTGLSTGPTRFFVPHAKARVPEQACFVEVLQAGKRRGIGELVAWTNRGLEFRGVVPRGRFRLRRARRRPLRGRLDGAHGRMRVRDASARSQIEDVAERNRLRLRDLARAWAKRCSARVLDADGRLVPRVRLRIERPGLRARVDLFLWPARIAGRERVELRIWIDALRAWRGLRLALPRGDWRCVALAPDLLRARNRDRALSAQSELRVDAVRLRPGDSASLVYVSTRASPGRGSTVVVLPPARLLDALGLPRPLRAIKGVERLRRRLGRAITELSRRRSVAFERGRDHEGELVFGHHEFDLAFGLAAWAICERDAKAWALGLRIAEQTLCCNRSRRWHSSAKGRRLPVRHGRAAGIGAVDCGHVFLQGVVVLAFASGDRLLVEEVIAALDELVELVAQELPRVERLRELAWPLLNLETGRRFVERGVWTSCVDKVLARLRSEVDVARGGFVLLGEHDTGYGRRRLDAWLSAGLLLPALELSSAPLAKALRRQLAKALAALPWRRGGLATHWLHDDARSWRPSSRSPPWAMAFLLEGFARIPRLAGRFRSARSRVAHELPDPRWDEATRLALCLRQAWIVRR